MTVIERVYNINYESLISINQQQVSAPGWQQGS
jgi:hypothetical protein